MKYEMKIEFNNNEILNEIIKKSYFDNGNNGKLIGKKYFSQIEKTDPSYILLKGLNNMTVRVLNNELIEGSLRAVIDESEDFANLYPCSIYCIIEDGKYSFY